MRSGIPRRPRSFRARGDRAARTSRVLIRDCNSACPGFARLHAAQVGVTAAVMPAAAPPAVLLRNTGRKNFWETGTKCRAGEFIQIRASKLECLMGVRCALTLPQISSHLGSQLGLAGLDTTLLFWGYCKTLPKTRIDMAPAMVGGADDDRTRRAFQGGREWRPVP